MIDISEIFEPIEYNGKRCCLQCGDEFIPYERIDIEGQVILETEFCCLFCYKEWYNDNMGIYD